VFTFALKLSRKNVNRAPEEGACNVERRIKAVQGERETERQKERERERKRERKRKADIAVA